MKNIVILSIFAISCLFLNNSKVFADWWERPSVQPTQPSVERPTTAPSPTQVLTQAPTSPPGQPTVTSTPPPTGGLPTDVPTPAGTSPDEEENEDPCASGKSYTGDYCGWSPRIGGEEEGVSGGGEEYITIAQAEEPEVLGLSYTSSRRDLTVSDIMLLAGVLCLLLYARSKMPIRLA